ncbi:MAG: hypothetical protein JWM53_771 [bacterium]|nr:hypothetical protein [bacterium]
MSDLETNLSSTFDAARVLVRDLTALGGGWLRYGLAVGQASARTLDEAARALGELTERLRK